MIAENAISQIYKIRVSQEICYADRWHPAILDTSTDTRSRVVGIDFRELVLSFIDRSGWGFVDIWILVFQAVKEVRFIWNLDRDVDQDQYDNGFPIFFERVSNKDICQKIKKDEHNTSEKENTCNSNWG